MPNNSLILRCGLFPWTGNLERLLCQKTYYADISFYTSRVGCTQRKKCANWSRVRRVWSLGCTQRKKCASWSKVKRVWSLGSSWIRAPKELRLSMVHTGDSEIDKKICWSFSCTPHSFYTGESLLSPCNACVYSVCSAQSTCLYASLI